MSHDFCDSFDRYASKSEMATSGKWLATGGGGFAAITPFGSGRSVELSSGWLQSKTWTNRSVQWFSCQLFRNFLIHLSLTDGGVQQFTICANLSSQLEVRTGSQSGAVIATVNSIFVLDTWAQIVGRAEIHNTLGRLTLYLNGSPTPFLDLVGVSLRGGTPNNYVNGVRIAEHGGGYNGRAKDVFCWNEDGVAPSGYIGQPRSYTVAAAGPGASTGFSARTGAATNWEANKQLPHDGDTSYVASSTAGETDLYAMGVPPVVPTHIYGLEHFIVWKRMDAGSRTVALRRRSGAVEGNLLTASDLPTAYRPDSFWEAKNPDGNVPWAYDTLPQLGPRIEA